MNSLRPSGALFIGLRACGVMLAMAGFAGIPFAVFSTVEGIAQLGLIGSLRQGSWNWIEIVVVLFASIFLFLYPDNLTKRFLRNRPETLSTVAFALTGLLLLVTGFNMFFEFARAASFAIRISELDPASAAGTGPNLIAMFTGPLTLIVAGAFVIGFSGRLGDWTNLDWHKAIVAQRTAQDESEEA